MVNSTQLGLLGPTDVIDWLPDETVYSLASRFHRLSGNVRQNVTARQLFGYARGGFPHDLPGGIAHLANAFSGRLGSAREITSRHTVLPALIAFRPARVRAEAFGALTEGAIGSLKARLGMLASGFGATLDLKACPDCVIEELRGVGTAYWHLEHQLPGVWLCRLHLKTLRVSASKRAGRARFDWLLPQIDDLVLPADSADLEEPPRSTIETLVLFANASIATADIGRDEPLCHGKAARVLRQRMQDLGLASASGRIQQQRVSRQFSAFMAPIRTIPELATIASSPSTAYSQLLTVLSAHEVGVHPLRVVSAIIWLFGTCDAFMSRYLMPIEAEPVECSAASSGAPGSLNDRVLDLMREDGSSISRTAATAGVAVSTVQAWAAAAGIESPKRPSVISGEKRRSLIAGLGDGKDVNLCAANAGISVSSVVRIMRTEVGLYQAWKDCRFERVRCKARAAWIDAMKQCSRLGVKIARAHAPSSYAWLYRNDRVWLAKNNESMVAILKSNNASVDWGERDRIMSQLVNNAVTRLVESGNVKAISLVDILAAVPQLKPKLRRLPSLPLTEQTIRAAVRLRDTGGSSAKFKFPTRS